MATGEILELVLQPHKDFDNKMSIKREISTKATTLNSSYLQT